MRRNWAVGESSCSSVAGVRTVTELERARRLHGWLRPFSISADDSLIFEESIEDWTSIFEVAYRSLLPKYEEIHSFLKVARHL
jgi:hypothetical protein